MRLVFRALPVAALAIVACNAVTGASNLEVDESGDIDAPQRALDGATTSNGDGGNSSSSSSSSGGNGDGSTQSTYTIGGTVNGLKAGKVVLQNNGGNDLDVSANGGGPVPFTFTMPVKSGDAYAVTRLMNPVGLSCSVSAGMGTVANADITNVVVSCGAPGNVVFAATGAAQMFTVPAWVTEVTLEAWGAQGNRNANGVLGGKGGYATGKLVVTPGQVLNVFVGGGNTASTAAGFNGGGVGGTSPCAGAAAGGGGGASDVRVSGTALANRVIVAGGGGGAAGDRVATCGRGNGGGGGDGYYGGGGGAAWPSTSTVLPKGGTQNAGGAGGTSAYASAPSNAGAAGMLGVGGAGGAEISSNQGGSATAIVGGAGGGTTGSDGQYGVDFTGESGAGGSGYIGGVTNGSMSSDNRSGAGQVTISY